MVSNHSMYDHVYDRMRKQRILLIISKSSVLRIEKILRWNANNFSLEQGRVGHLKSQKSVLGVRYNLRYNAYTTCRE